jgi:hypothetical protein
MPGALESNRHRVSVTQGAKSGSSMTSSVSAEDFEQEVKSWNRISSESFR